MIQLPGSTNRGVHWAPYGFPGGWSAKAIEWVDLLRSMRISWIVLISEDDAMLKPLPELMGMSAVQYFLRNDINPVIRFKVKLDRGWPVMDHVETLVRQFSEYNLSPMILIGNEPGDGREYAGDVPQDWPERYIGYFIEYGSRVVKAGGIALFADGPGYPFDPFEYMEPVFGYWESMRMGYAGHWYGLNRPPNYPYDSVTQTGKPLLTEDDLKEWFGPFYNDRGLNDVPVEMVNEARQNGKQPGLTALDDTTCWRGWEEVQHWMIKHFGKTLLMCETEGGWTPGAIAGSGNNRDLRFLRPTPDHVAEWTMYSFQANTPLLFQCHWILGDSVLGGSGGWDMDAWCTGWWRHGGPEYWYYMPVVKALKENEINPASVRIVAAQTRLEMALTKL